MSLKRALTHFWQLNKPVGVLLSKLFLRQYLSAEVLALVTNVLNASDVFNIIQDAYIFFPLCHIEQSPRGKHHCQDEGAQRQGVRSGESSSSEEGQIG